MVSPSPHSSPAVVGQLPGKLLNSFQERSIPPLKCYPSLCESLHFYPAPLPLAAHRILLLNIFNGNTIYPITKINLLEWTDSGLQDKK